MATGFAATAAVDDTEDPTVEDTEDSTVEDSEDTTVEDPDPTVVEEDPTGGDPGDPIVEDPEDATVVVEEEDPSLADGRVTAGAAAVGCDGDDDANSFAFSFVDRSIASCTRRLDCW